MSCVTSVSSVRTLRQRGVVQGFFCEKQRILSESRRSAPILLPRSLFFSIISFIGRATSSCSDSELPIAKLPGGARNDKERRRRRSRAALRLLAGKRRLHSSAGVAGIAPTRLALPRLLGNRNRTGRKPTAAYRWSTTTLWRLAVGSLRGSPNRRRDARSKPLATARICYGLDG